MSDNEKKIYTAAVSRVDAFHIRPVSFLMMFLTLLMFSSEASADRRIFAFTYPYMTLPKGAFELEHYLDLGLNGWDDESTPLIEKRWTEIDWRHQIEIEYGILDRLDFGFYNVFRQKPYGELTYEGIKLRTRYRFGDPGALFIDPGLYFEVAWSGHEVAFEEMVIIAKSYKGLETSLNIKAEQEVDLTRREVEHEVIFTLGIGYHFNPHFALGLEYFGKMKIAEGDLEYFVSYLGPSLSVATGVFYWTIAVQPQLGSRKSLAAIQVRSLLGIFL